MQQHLEVNLFKHPFIDRLWRHWHVRRGCLKGDCHDLSDDVRLSAPGCRFVDNGCMRGVNGNFALLAEELEDTLVNGVDVFAPLTGI